MQSLAPQYTFGPTGLSVLQRLRSEAITRISLHFKAPYEKLICVFMLHNSMLQSKILNKKLRHYVLLSRPVYTPHSGYLCSRPKDEREGGSKRSSES